MFIGEGERLVHLLGPVVVDEKIPDARAELKEEFAKLKDEE